MALVEINIFSKNVFTIVNNLKNISVELRSKDMLLSEFQLSKLMKLIFDELIKVGIIGITWQHLHLKYRVQFWVGHDIIWT